MRIVLLAFASASDVLGEAEMPLDLPPSASIADLKQLLEKRYPLLAPHWEGLAIAVNGELSNEGRRLAEGDEVALLPPVSGGLPAGPVDDEPMVLQDGPLDVAEIVRRVETPACGAVVVFVGNVRDHHAGRPVEKITYSAYRRMAERRIRSLCADLERRFAGARIALVHRLGEIEAGVASVVIAVASPHRAAAYEANREVLERLKAEVPIWKREHYGDGASAWREEEPLVTAGERPASTPSATR